MILVDTSSWVPFLRKDGSPEIKARVVRIMQEGSAVVCPVVLAELWMGAASPQDQSHVQQLQDVLPCLPVGEIVWERSYALARICRALGTPVPASDLIIAACAFVHGASIEANDKHFPILDSYRER